MKFKFRLDSVMRQRKIEQDLAQRIHAEAEEKLRFQMSYIKSLYCEIDKAQAQIESLQLKGGACSSQLMQISEFILGQKQVIQKARAKARELMSIEEEKLEILVAKMQNHKVIEKLKEKQKLEFRKAKNKKMTKEADDLNTIRFQVKR